MYTFFFLRELAVTKQRHFTSRNPICPLSIQIHWLCTLRQASKPREGNYDTEHVLFSLSMPPGQESILSQRLIYSTAEESLHLGRLKSFKSQTFSC